MGMYQEELPDLQKRRKRQLGLLAVVALLIIGLAAHGLNSQSALTPGGRVSGANRISAMFHGLPQSSGALGRPGAPVTLVEYGDLQCPVCSSVAKTVLPGLLGEVRSGRLRIVYRPLGFLGADSQRAAWVALALGEQNRLWQFADLFYANQGIENSNYVTGGFLRSLIRAIPGASVAKAITASNGPAVHAQAEAANAAAAKLYVNQVPTFFVGRTGGPLHQVRLSVLSTAALRSAIDRAG